MNKLTKKIQAIPKSYFSLRDLGKISDIREESLRVAVSRMVSKGELTRVRKGIYTLDVSKIDPEELAIEVYAPSYLSFEWVLARSGILSQQPSGLTLATTKRGRTIKDGYFDIYYRHLDPRKFWGFYKEGNTLLAENEKAFLDLAYLAMKGYGRLDLGEMNVSLLDRKKLKLFLKKFDSKGLEAYLKFKI